MFLQKARLQHSIRTRSGLLRRMPLASTGIEVFPASGFDRALY
jgi:hypothetical protein